MFIKELNVELAKLGVEVKPAFHSDKIGGLIHTQEQFTCGKDVPASELALKIREFASAIQFVPVQLPASGVEFSCLYRIGNIYVRYLEAYKPRYLEAYKPGSDNIIGRYDVIVVKW